MTHETTNTDLDRFMVYNTSVESALARLDQVFRRAHGRGQPTGLTLTGESGSGKTTILKCFALRHPPTRTALGVQMPILMVTVPANPNLRELASALLDALDADPGRARETEAQKTRRLKVLIKNLNVRMLILEEFQHFGGKTDQRLVVAADWLKVLIDETKIIVVLSGLPSARRVLLKNEQLARRFSAKIETPRFDWRNHQDVEQFTGILQTFQANIVDYQFPVMPMAELAFRFWLGTGGLICYIKQILIETIWICQDAGKTQISMEDFATVWEQSITTVSQRSSNRFNPFSLQFNVLDPAKMDSLIAFARSIGTTDV